MAKLTGKYALAERGDRGTNIAIYVILTFASIAVIYPLWFVLVASFSDPSAITAGKVILWPVDFTLDGYGFMFKETKLWTAYARTLIYCVISTVYGLNKLIPAAYALSRPELPGRKWITLFFMLTMYFSGGTVPTFVLISNIGWFDNPASILFAGGIAASSLVIVRSYFMSNIPDSLFDAARIDGCNITWFFRRVVLPLSGPIIAIQVLGMVQGMWNSYMGPNLYLQSEKWLHLQQVVRKITGQGEFSFVITEGMTEEEIRVKEQLARQSQLIKYSTVIATAIPMIIIYPFVQKHFVKGIMVGSVKG